MGGQIGLKPLILTEADKLRDRIDTLRSEVRRLRAQLASAGDNALMRLERAADLARRWRSDGTDLIKAADDPANSSGARLVYRERGARLRRMANELDAAVRT
jgi:uncharacterized small protein (DUF1192 family)